MCGRFTLTVDPETLRTTFELPTIAPSLAPRYNIAPWQQVPIVRLTTQGTRRLDLVQWGLVPHWATDASLGRRLINARIETLEQKPAFREAWLRRRCLVPADGFFEWQRDTGKRGQPFLIRLPNAAPFAMAGLWERWRDPEGRVVESCAIITTDANAQVRGIHDRMPAIIEPQQLSSWIDRTNSNPDQLRALLRSSLGDKLEAFPVSAHVNRPANDDPACIEPIDGAALGDPAD